MIKIYNEAESKGHTEDTRINEVIHEFFDEHRYLDFTNALVWIKEVNPENSRGLPMYECSIEARMPNQEPLFASKKDSVTLNAVREALDTIKEEMLKKKSKIRSVNRSRETRI